MQAGFRLESHGGAVLMICGLLGCQSPPDQMTPALIDAGRPGAVEEITDVISSALGRRVRLSAEAFSRSSVITLEHQPPETIAGRPATGLITEKPEQFRLVRTNTGCALVRLQTGERFGLQDDRCRPQSID